MEESLTKRSVETKRDYVLKPLSATEGAHARDALCKAIYGRMFSWIVGKINSSIKVLVTNLSRAGDLIFGPCLARGSIYSSRRFWGLNVGWEPDIGFMFGGGDLICGFLFIVGLLQLLRILISSVV